MAERKTWLMLENNPSVMTSLAHTLGLSPTAPLSFHDLYSLDSSDPSSFSHIPRPCSALLAIIPLTPTWSALRSHEDTSLFPSPSYPSPDDNLQNPPSNILWFKQTITHACGSIGLLHILLNSPSAQPHILPNSTLTDIRARATPLDSAARAQMLHDHPAFEAAHKSVQQAGDTIPPDPSSTEGGHFVAFVKAADGTFWELEGSRRGPLLRGVLEPDEDVLSERALDMGIRKIINAEKAAGGDSDLRFSCIALAV